MVHFKGTVKGDIRVLRPLSSVHSAEATHFEQKSTAFALNNGRPQTNSRDPEPVPACS